MYASTCIDTATAYKSSILRGIHYPGNGPVVKDIVTYGRAKRNELNPGMMCIAQHQKGDALRCRLCHIDVAPTRTYFM
jgi:acetamidase/formamidase